MSALPQIRSRVLAPAGTLAGDVISGAPAAAGLQPDSLRSGEDGRIGRGGSRDSDTGPPSAPVSADAHRIDPEAFAASSPAARAKLADILAGNGTVVKALTAIQLAARIEKESGKPCMAVFWIASDDHDWEEVGGMHVVTTSNDLREIRLHPPEDRVGRPVGLTALPPSITSLVDELVDALPESEFVPHFVGILRDAYRPDATLGSAFAAALSKILAGLDFAWLDGGAEGAKRASGPLFRWALDNHGDVKHALESSTATVREAGYDPQVPILPGATAVFYDTGHRRERLYADPASDGAFRAGRNGADAERAVWRERLDSEPARFSANVALRPVLESWLMPVAATVLGPGEIAYWTQLSDLFRLAGVAAPEIVPRAAWNVVEAKIDRTLAKVSLDPSELADGGVDAIRRLAEGAKPASITASLQELRTGLEHGYHGLRTAVSEHLPGIRSAVDKSAKQSFREIASLESRIESRIREREAAAIEQIRKCALHLYPGGQPQERQNSPFYFLARYGAPFVQQLADETEACLVAGVEKGG
jgi:bacillithiol biosynthesis cysteine-adding enzyme BshC